MHMTAEQLVQEARTAVREVDVGAVSQRPADAVLIDVREPMEFATGHIAGAVNIPRGVLEFQVEAHPAVANVEDDALARRNRPLILYCRTGGRAALAAANLQRMGFGRVSSLAGGIAAWQAAGLPLTQHQD